MSNSTGMPPFSEWWAAAQSTFSTYQYTQFYPQPESEINPQPAPAGEVQRTFEPQNSVCPQHFDIPPKSLLPSKSPLDMAYYEAIQKNIEARLLLCPNRTYCVYPSPSPKLHYFSFVTEISNRKYIHKWKILERGPDLFQLDGFSGFYSKIGLEQAIKNNFSQSLIECEAKRKKETITILSSPFHCEDSAQDKDFPRRFENSHPGTYLLIKLSINTPIFALLFKDCFGLLNSKTILVEETGFLLFDNQRYQSFHHLASIFNLQKPLITQELNKLLTEKVVDEISEKTETEEKSDALKTEDGTKEMNLPKFSDTVKPLSPQKPSPEEEKLIAEARASYEKQRRREDYPKIIIHDGRPIFCPTPIRYSKTTSLPKETDESKKS